MNSLAIQGKTVGPVKNPNCKFTFVQVVKLLVLFPFFSVKNAESGLGKLFGCKKDMLYRLMDDGRMDWRRLLYSINWQLIGKVSRRADAKKATRCVIIDDTDLPKCGWKAEGLRKVFFHSALSCHFLFLLSAVFLFLMFSSCAGKGNQEGIASEVVDFASFQESDFSRLLEEQKGNCSLIILQTDDSAAFLSSIDKFIVDSKGDFHILDWPHRRMVSFEKDGRVKNVLDRCGRGPQEYILASDFAIDDAGNYHVLDGRSDEILIFDSGSGFISRRKMPFEASSIAVLSGEKYLLGLDPWNHSKYSGKKVVRCDRNLNVDETFFEYGRNVDSNFEFSSIDFSVSDAIFYHKPIDDNVYLFDRNGVLQKRYRFDFGSKRVPDEYKSNVEKNLEKLAKSRFLVNTIFIGSEWIVGTIRESGVRNFVIDRVRNRLYLDNRGSGLTLLFSSGDATYYLVDGGKGASLFSSGEISEWSEEGRVLIIRVALKSISS